MMMGPTAWPTVSIIEKIPKKEPCRSSGTSDVRVIAGRMQLRVSLVVLVNVAAASSLPLIGPCSEPRNIYIDLGVNWCNTARLFKDIEPESWPFYVSLVLF